MMRNSLEAHSQRVREVLYSETDPRLILFLVPHEVKVFDSHPVFMDRPSEESDAAWELLGGRKYLRNLLEGLFLIFTQLLETIGVSSS